MLYGTVSGWRAYATERGNGAPAAATDPLASAALQRASDYIYYHYAQQATMTIPVELAECATYEAANFELAKPGFFNKTYSPAEMKVLTEVEGIKWTVVGNAAGQDGSMMPTSTLIDAMLERYVGRNAGIGIWSIGC